MRCAPRTVRNAVAAALLSLVASTPSGLDGQAVEVLVGGRTPSTHGPGVRVIARVASDFVTTTYTAVSPLSASEGLLVQRALLELGYGPGPLDGLVGPRVLRAIDELRRDLGHPVCACIDGRTLDALGLRPRVVQTFLPGADEGPPIEIIRPVRPARRVTDAGPEEAGGEGAAPGGAEPARVYGAIPVIPILRPARRSERVTTEPSGGRPLGVGAAGTLRRGSSRPPRSRGR
ncbi:MAG: hypothetical protein MJB57_13045 [Gemmatimonadetes bacterium]|nr:hypothetical protein [Gemmatimonadota bacterium]